MVIGLAIVAIACTNCSPREARDVRTAASFAQGACELVATEIGYVPKSEGEKIFLEQCRRSEVWVDFFLRVSDEVCKRTKDCD